MLTEWGTVSPGGTALWRREPIPAPIEVSTVSPGGTKRACYTFFVDPQIDELKELVRRNIALSEDTNRMVHKVRRGAAWGRFFMVLWWLLIIAASGVAYYYYQPYLLKIEQAYSNLQTDQKQAQTYESQISNFFGDLLNQQSTTTSH